MGIENFLESWNAETEETTSSRRVRNRDGVIVELSRSSRNEHTIRLNSIKSTSFRKGEVRNFFKWLTAQADKHDFVISMCVQPFGWNAEKIPSKDQLRDFAKKHGFVVEYKYPDGNGYEMFRRPA